MLLSATQDRTPHHTSQLCFMEFYFTLQGGHSSDRSLHGRLTQWGYHLPASKFTGVDIEHLLGLFWIPTTEILMYVIWVILHFIIQCYGTVCTTPQLQVEAGRQDQWMSPAFYLDQISCHVLPSCILVLSQVTWNIVFSNTNSWDINIDFDFR